jgi:membrane dipeptidase
VSHISDEGFWDICDITEAPIIASHSNSRKVCASSRNLTDEMFREICRTGGVAGINQGAWFIGNEPDLDTVCDHFLHFMELDPEGKHIALGGDLDGVDKFASGFSGIESYHDLADRLITRGLSEKNIEDIFWNNALGVMQRAVCNHKK